MRGYKPNLVSAEADYDHSSSPDVAIGIERPTRKRPRIAPEPERAARSRFPIWPCTAKSLPGRDCYQTRRWALTSPFHPSPFRAGIFSVALVVVRRKRTPGCYPARCPLVFGLSSLALRNSDHPPHFFV